MSDSLTIPADAAGRIDVFAVDLPPEMMDRFVSRAGNTDDPEAAWPLRAALGADYLDPTGLELVGVRDLAGVGLSGYLSQGLGADDDDVSAHEGALDALDGHVLILRGRAYGGVAQTLTPRAPLTHIATLSEEPSTPAGPALRAHSAEPGGPVPADAGDGDQTAPKGRGSPVPLVAGALALAALLVLALALWVGA